MCCYALITGLPRPLRGIRDYKEYYLWVGENSGLLKAETCGCHWGKSWRLLHLCTLTPSLPRVFLYTFFSYIPDFTIWETLFTSVSLFADGGFWRCWLQYNINWLILSLSFLSLSPDSPLFTIQRQVFYNPWLFITYMNITGTMDLSVFFWMRFVNLCEWLVNVFNS